MAETAPSGSPVPSARDVGPPVFVTTVGADASQAASTRRSVEQQTYPGVREIPVEDGSTWGMKTKEPAYWMRLPAGMLLEKTAIEHLMQPLIADPFLAAA